MPFCTGLMELQVEHSKLHFDEKFEVLHLKWPSTREQPPVEVTRDHP